MSDAFGASPLFPLLNAAVPTVSSVKAKKRLALLAGCLLAMMLMGGAMQIIGNHAISGVGDVMAAVMPEPLAAQGAAWHGAAMPSFVLCCAVMAVLAIQRAMAPMRVATRQRGEVLFGLSGRGAARSDFLANAGRILRFSPLRS